MTKKFTFTPAMERKLREFDNAISTANKQYRYLVKVGKITEAIQQRKLASEIRREMKSYELTIEGWATNGIPTC